MTNSRYRPPLVEGNKSLNDVTEDILRPMQGPAPAGWKILMGVAACLVLFGGYCLGRTIWDGIGMWGENKSINWAWDITNFVWWIGIGHAGTLISAILLLFRQEWRNSINRSAEAMTIAAVTCSAIFVLGHVGRIWVIYWIFPIPNTYGSLWVNFNSALVWDAFAVLTYLLVSILFWYLGLIPDLATLRDRSSGFKKKLYKMLSFSWDNSAWSWRRYHPVMLTLAGLATPLVLSVHSIVSMDFATGIIPGWHSTIFPPYFVIGAILSGFAMVVTLMTIMRKVYHLEAYITVHHVDYMNQIIIAHSLGIGIAYFTENFIAYYADKYEGYMAFYRVTGEYRILYYIMILCNVALPQLLWFKSLRTNYTFSFIMSLVINLGMWIERFVLIVTSISRDFLPSSWAVFTPTMYDIGTFLFSVGVFLSLFLLFARYIPVVNIFEVQESLMQQKNGKRHRRKKEPDLILPD